MLLHKAWLETRVRLALAGAMLAFVCAVIVLFGNGPGHHVGGDMPFITYVWNGVYKDYVRSVFVVLVIVLGGGTLLQEAGRGTVGFTLSLPASRRELLAWRAALGLCEVWALAAVPALVIPFMAMAAGEHYPLALAGRFALLWAVGGSAIFSLSLLWASVVSNEYVAWTATFLTLMAVEAGLNYSFLSAFPVLDVLRLMNGTAWPSFDPRVAELVGGPPWGGLVGTLLGAGALLLLTDRISGTKEYA